jgi:hypothetical protein
MCDVLIVHSGLEQVLFVQQAARAVFVWCLVRVLPWMGVTCSDPAAAAAAAAALSALLL